MPANLADLLAAERQGRLIIHRFPPEKGKPWEITVLPGGGAGLAAARWADRYGAKTAVHLADGASGDPVCAVLAEPLRRLGLLRSRPVGDGVRLPPPDDPVWSMQLSGNGALFVRPASAVESTLTVEETREIDRRSIDDFALPGLCLMENAAVGAAMVVCDLMGGGDWTAAVAAGGGNNAGDGLAVARGLASLGKRVRVVLLKDPARLSHDASANLELLRSAPGDIEIAGSPEAAFADCDVVVDALLGTGFSGELAGPMLRAAEAINEAKARIVALDLPSGMSGNGGVIGPAVRADRTVTFGNLKPGLLASGAAPLVGDLYVAEIGAPGAVPDRR